MSFGSSGNGSFLRLSPPGSHEYMFPQRSSTMMMSPIVVMPPPTFGAESCSVILTPLILSGSNAVSRSLSCATFSLSHEYCGARAALGFTKSRALYHALVIDLYGKKRYL